MRKKSRTAKVSREKRVVRVPAAPKYTVSLVVTLDGVYSKKYVKDMIFDAVSNFSYTILKTSVRAVDVD